ncbi:MAG: hypothetical protein NDI77_17445, partial [Geobacteraceae bacterium]|nr:hypothetical protein [Geobacteraceae bacterium]
MRRMVNTIMTAVVLAALAVAGTANAATFTPGTLDTPSPPGHGFPRWYTEPSPPAASGQSLELCLSQTASTNPDALGGLMCILLPEPAPPAPPTIFDPAAAIVFPTNFPSESFYFIADAILLNLGGGNRATYRAAIEAAF